MPALSSFLRVASFSGSPPRRAGLRITRTFTPRCWASITAASSAGSSKRNIFTRSDRFAAASASRSGCAPSSGMIINERDIGFPFATPAAGVAPTCTRYSSA